MPPPSTRVTNELNAAMRDATVLEHYVQTPDEVLWRELIAMHGWTVTDVVDFLYLLRNGTRVCTAADILEFFNFLSKRGGPGQDPPQPPWRS
jgi:hypothetical protein